MNNCIMFPPWEQPTSTHVAMSHLGNQGIVLKWNKMDEIYNTRFYVQYVNSFVCYKSFMLD